MFNSSLEFDFSDGETAAANDAEQAAQPTLGNAAIAGGLERIADLLQGAQAHARREVLRRAAASIRFSARPVTELVAESGVEGVHALGINYELSGVVTDWVRSGRLPWLEALESRRRRELIALPGIGPKLARELREVLGVIDLDGLARAAREGQLQRLCGIGPKRLKMIETVLGVRTMAAERETGPVQLPLSAA